MRSLTIAMLAAAFLPLAAHAALGGAPGNVGTPVPVVLRAAQPVTAFSGPTTSDPSSRATSAYTLHQSVDANGVTIREYTLPNNVVFAVTWDGPIRPDMTKLLGSYFPNFATAAQGSARGTGPLIEGSEDFRIESAGRLGHFFGIAYVPRLMPNNVQPGDLQ